MIRRPPRLRFEPVDSFVVDGEVRGLKDGRATGRQLSLLNAMGCLYLVEPDTVAPLDRRNAAGAIDTALRLVGSDRVLLADEQAARRPVRDLLDEAESLFEDGVWRITSEIASGIDAYENEIREALSAAPDRFVRLRSGEWVGRSRRAMPWGTVSMFVALEEEFRS